jgi:hypothetical protein
MGKPKGTKQPEIRTIFMPLPVDINDEERKERGLTLATEIEARGQTDLERKDTMSEFKDRIAKHDSMIGRLSAVLRSGKELRQVEVHDLPDYDRKQWQRVRMDTGEQIAILTMSEDDLQLRIDTKKETNES